MLSIEVRLKSDEKTVEAITWNISRVDKATDYYRLLDKSRSLYNVVLDAVDAIIYPSKK